MKILSLHCDYIKFKPLKKALKSIELKEGEDKQVEVEEPLGIFVAIEKQDESNKKIVDELVENVLDLKEKVRAERVVLYPYAHLSSSLSDPKFAQETLEAAEAALKKKKIETYRAPFGYYKEFELKCKGHPLAELSRQIGEKPEVQKPGSKKESKEEGYDSKQLLRQISKSKLMRDKLKENDHRILGQEMDLFSFSEVAPGMVFWHDKGLSLYEELINFMKGEMRKDNYQLTKTPEILDKKLWQISGHWEKYKDNIFLTEYDGREFAVKPMNCPGGMLIFKNSPKSYKDLPLRAGEFGIVHRQELSGVLGGLFRVIQFTQDDAHVFCTEDQLESEIVGLINLVERVLSKFGFNYDVELSTRPEKRIGSDKIWDKAESALEKVLKKKKIKFKINEGDGAFYGPKIDFHIKDSLNRSWQLSTIQLDFAMPERFELEYKDNDGKDKRPIMLHRAIYGSLERFIGILLEHTNGRLPTWLAPVQVKLLSFTDNNIKSVEAYAEELKAEGVRVEINTEAAPMGGRIRDAENQKIPYIIVIGDKEEKAKELAVRKEGKVKNEKREEFTKSLIQEIKDRA